MSDYSTRNIIDYAFDADGTKFRDELYGSIHDRISAHIDAKKQEIARGLVGQNEEVEGLEEASINFDMHPKYTDKIENQLNNLGIKTKTKPNGNITATHKDKAHLEKHVATMQKYWGPEHIRRDKLNDRNVKDGVARMKARGDYPRQNEEVEGLEEAFPDASGKEVLGYDEYKARMKKLSDRQLKYAQKKHEREYGPDTGKRGPTGSITRYSVNNKGKLPEEYEGLDENQNPSKHWEAGYDHATEAAEDAGFSKTAEHRKKNMLSHNPHKSGTKAHQDWHEGASDGHEHAISKMNEEVESLDESSFSFTYPDDHSSGVKKYLKKHAPKIKTKIKPSKLSGHHDIEVSHPDIEHLISHVGEAIYNNGGAGLGFNRDNARKQAAKNKMKKNTPRSSEHRGDYVEID